MSKQRNPFERRTRRQHADAHAWAVSYVDLLTLLLCFFIIFFNMKKVDTQAPFLTEIVHAFRSAPKEAGQKVIGAKASSAPQVESEGESRDLSGASETIKKIALTGFVRDHGKVGLAHNQLIIEIPRVSFFPSAKKHLTPEGEAFTKKMIEGLRPYQGRIHVTVQGHTDPRPYKGSTLEDNWELSVLRASTVLKRFISEGFPQEDLSAEGFADQRAARVPADDASEEELAHLRRITLKIREKGHD